MLVIVYSLHIMLGLIDLENLVDSPYICVLCFKVRHARRKNAWITARRDMGPTPPDIAVGVPHAFARSGNKVTSKQTYELILF